MTLLALRRFWPVLAALAAGLLLAAAHGFETFGGESPCELCLKQRDLYWLIVWAGLLLALACHIRPSLLRLTCVLIAALFLAECALAVYHAGVESKFWPGPASCTRAGAPKLTVADMTQLLTRPPVHIVQCDTPPWRVLGLSMAGCNAIVALLLGMASLLVAGRKATVS